MADAEMGTLSGTLEVKVAKRELTWVDMVYAVTTTAMAVFIVMLMFGPWAMTAKRLADTEANAILALQAEATHGWLVRNPDGSLAVKPLPTPQAAPPVKAATP